MATLEKFKQSAEERRRRTFSEEFKRKKVREIEQKITTISEVSKAYEVRYHNVYKWLKKYGTHQSEKGVRVIIECESDTRKNIELQAKVAELERTIGQKQVLLDFKDKIIDLAEEMYQIDIKKKFGIKPSSIIGNTEKI
ncbi:MAG: transposase [Bacteroidetes bacterium CG_4_10_14_3_um_filter_31_20]|nr:MAG: transposase [Bacteroidetes bacterium CG_4_10_14_3_um_filter_31_20]